jgi:hypothetical protein
MHFFKKRKVSRTWWSLLTVPVAQEVESGRSLEPEFKATHGIIAT